MYGIFQRMPSLFVIVSLIAFLSACSKSGDAEKEKKAKQESTALTNISLATSESAILFFQKRGMEILKENRDKLKNPELIKLLENKENITARKKNLRNCYKNIQDSLSEEQQDDGIIYGKLENLGFLSDAWEIEVGKFEIKMGGCIEVKSGKIKVLWVSQETADSVDEPVDEPKSDDTPAANSLPGEKPTDQKKPAENATGGNTAAPAPSDGGDNNK